MAYSQSDNMVLSTITSTVSMFGELGVAGIIEVLKSILEEIKKVASGMLQTLTTTLQKNFVELINCTIRATKYLIDGKMSEACKEASNAIKLLTPILEILSLVPPLALITGVLLALIYFCEHKNLLAIGALLGVLFVGIKWLMKLKPLSKFYTKFMELVTKGKKLQQANPGVKTIGPANLSSSVRNIDNPKTIQTVSNIKIKPTSTSSVASTNKPKNVTSNVSKGESSMECLQKEKLLDLTMKEKKAAEMKVIESKSQINKGVTNEANVVKESGKGVSDSTNIIGEKSGMGENSCLGQNFDSNNYYGITTNNTGGGGLNGLLDNGTNGIVGLGSLRTYTPKTMFEAQNELWKYGTIGGMLQRTPKPKFGI